MSALTILIIDESPERAQLNEAALQDAGYRSIDVVAQISGLVRQIEAISPNVIIRTLFTARR